MSDSENEYIENTQAGGTIVNDVKIMNIARNMVRYILSIAQNTNTIITKSRLQDKIRELRVKENASNIKFETVFEQINKILMDIYGYKLLGYKTNSNNLNANTNKETNEDENVDRSIDSNVVAPDRLTHRSNNFILINNMKYIENFEEFIISQKSLQFGKTIINGDYIGNDNDHSITNTLNNSLNDDKSLVTKGILTIIISIIVFSKNNILYNELIEYLNKFGIPTDDTTNIPILDLKFSELIKRLEKKEYLSKYEEKSSIEGEVITYRLGRRTKVEFPIDSLVSLVHTVLNIPNDQLKSLKDDIIKNIGDSYT